MNSNEMFNALSASIEMILNPNPIPERILKSGNATIVFWRDGTKTVVKPEANTTLDDYTAFVAATAKKVYGSNSRIKKLMKELTEVQERRK